MFKILEPFFRALSDGKIIRLTVAWVLRVLAVLGALGGVIWFVGFIALGIKSTGDELGTRSAGVLLGFLLFALFGLCFGYLFAGICIFRARTVLELGDSHFTVLSIVSILFRLNGELVFVTYSLIGVGGCLFVWLTNFSPLSEFGLLGERLPFGEGGASGFVGGIELAIFFLLIAFFGIVLSYALAELSIVLVEIALNTRGLRTAGTAPAAAVAPASVMPIVPPVPVPAPAPVQQPAVPVEKRCKKCGQPVDATATFCGECGSPVG
jgi:hypothetical protein